MASICVALSCSPAAYWSMTGRERDAIISELNRIDAAQRRANRL